MYSAIIIDDEEMARTLLEGMIAEYCDNVKTIELCKDLPSGVKAIRRHKPDIVFLDIEMPGHSGIELLDFFDEHEINFSIIFVTAYNHYAIQALKLSATDYLLKPIEVDDLKTSIKLFERNRSKNKELNLLLKSNLLRHTTKKIALNTLNSIVFVETDNVLYFQADGSYTKVVLNDNKVHTISKGLKHFESLLLDTDNFYRCHKSYLVNLNYVTDYIKSGGGNLIINRTHEISVSEDKLEILLQRIGLF